METEASKPRRKLSAILMVDVAGFSRMMGRDEEGTTTRIRAFHTRTQALVEAHDADALKPAQRDRMLAQMVDVLTRAITGDQQDQNPAAWYYLGRYYVEKGDARGADSAFARAEKLAPQCAQDIAGYRRQTESTCKTQVCGRETAPEGSGVVPGRRPRGGEAPRSRRRQGYRRE